MKLVINSRLAVTENKLGELYLPRIVRLCRKFNFSKSDSKIAIDILVIQSGYYHKKGRKYREELDSQNFCQMLDIPLKEVLEFLSNDRPHIKEGFFPDEEDYVVYHPDLCKALTYSQLKSKDFQKIEHTKLADVIAEEPGKEHFR